MIHSKDEVSRLLEKLDTDKAETLESETIEFKEWDSDWSSHPKKLYRVLAEYAICFANAEGGTLVLGVRDKVKGREEAIVGCGPYNLQEIRRQIYELTDPPLSVTPEELFLESLGVKLLLLHIPPRAVPFHTLKDGSAKVRVGNQCMPLTGSLRTSRIIELGELDITAQTLTQKYSEILDPSETERLRNLTRLRLPNSPLLNLREAQFLEQIGITQKGKVTKGGLLLVGKEPVIREVFPSHEVEYLRMTSEFDYERRETYHCGLLKALEEVYRNIELYNKIVPIQVGLYRYEIKDFPEETYREAVLNAVLHRDYTQPGSVFIKHYPYRLDISNPGGLLAGITPENILRQDSHPRNRHLAEIIRRIGLIEKAGVGVKRMFHTQLVSGKMPPSYWTDGHSVRVTLQNGVLDKAFVEFLRRQESSGKLLDLDQLLVLSTLRRQRELSLAKASELLQLNRERTHQILMQMIKEGLLERSGAGKGTVFRLSGTAYKDLGESVAYIRERDIDAIRHEELLLEFARRYGSITNRQVRELLGLDQHRASRLLRKLSEQGKLVRTGKFKGAVYKLSYNP